MLRQVRTLAIGSLALFLAGEAPATAQTWRDDFQLRKTFDGGKGEQLPASIAYVNPPDGEHYWLIDVALRVKEFKSASGGFTFSPVAEYHRADAEPLRKQQAVHKASAGVVADASFSNNVRLLAGVDWKRNLADRQNEGSASLLASYYFPRKPFGTADGGVWGQYRVTPFAGVEYYRNLALKAGSAEAAPAFTNPVITSRLFFELRLLKPLPVDPGAPKNDDWAFFTVEFDASFRRTLTSAVADKDLPTLSLSATYWLASEQRFGVGYSLEIGQAALANFARQRRAVISLVSKIGQ